jgi:hypothetical protein
MLFKNIAMRIDIENVEIHVRLLVEHRISDDKKKKAHKTEEEFLGGQLIGTVRKGWISLKTNRKVINQES